MGAAMKAARAAADPDDKTKTYHEQLKQLAEVRSAYNDAAMASGNWHVQTVKNVSASEAFTDKVRKQKLSITELTRAYKDYRKTGGGALGEAIKEQIALRNATATQLTSSLFGKNQTDLHLPKNLGPELDSTRVKLGLISQAIQSASTQMVNWGKNTQWAGRQITVGLTMPIGMAAVGVAALALDIDKELTRTAKVYDTVSSTAAGQEAELSQLRETGLANATRMANEYGAAMKDTLNVQAQLAATGLSGTSLQQATSEVVRIATLGEMDYQQAIDMTISLQTAFKLSNEELTDTFNRMNAVENATSLSLQDIAESVPRAASAFSALGGTAEQMVVMMTAMKESGVDAAVGANALKSATSALLDPSKEAIQFFDQNFRIDLPKIVQEANGNIYDLMQRLTQMTQGMDPTKIQQGINALFGRYQFDRLTALWTNMGDAMVGVENQTRASMDAVGMSAADAAALAAQEVQRWQESIQGRWKRAIEGMKATFVPLGLTIIEVFTPVVEWIGKAIDAFNGLSGVTKGIILTILGLAAVAGPLLMIVGIFANLIGNVAKFGASISAMRTKFRAMNASEAAAEIMAKRAASAFDTEGGAVAQLTLQIKALTEAMEQNAVASGTMMNAAGRIGDRQVIPGANGLEYAPGSVDKNGKPLTGAPDAEDLARYQQVAVVAQEVDETTEKTRSKWSRIGPLMSNAGMVALPLFAAMQIDAGGTAGFLLDSALVLGGIAQMAPLDKVTAKATEFVKKTHGALFNIKNWKTAASAAGEVIGGMAGSVGGLFQRGGKHAATGAAASGIKGITSGLGGVSGILGKVKGLAMSTFGPVGILAGGALIVWGIAEAANNLEDSMKALTSTGQQWADALGYTFTPGALSGVSSEYAKEANAINAAQKAMTESTEGLGDAMVSAGEQGRGYEAAMSQALQVITSGGTAENAKTAFEASLQMTGLGDAEIEEMRLRFAQVNLDDPEGVKSAIEDQINGALKGMNTATMDTETGYQGFWEGLKSSVSNDLGGDLSDQARAAGLEAGAALAEGLRTSESDAEKAAQFDQVAAAMNESFRGKFREIYQEVAEDPERKKIFDDMGIKTADELQTAMKNIDKKVDADEALSPVEQKFYDEFNNWAGEWQGWADFGDQYEEMVENIVQGMVNTGDLTQEEADKILESVDSINQLKIHQVGVDPEGATEIVSITDAYQNYKTALGQAFSSRGNLTEAEKLAILNAHRASAGLNAAKSSTEGFGDAIDESTGQVDEFAMALASIEPSADQYVQKMQDTFGGTMNDVYGEAQRRFDEMNQNELDGYRRAGDAAQDSLDRQGKAQDKYYDDLEKKQDNAQRNEERGFEKRWDAREKAVEDSYDRRIDAIDKQIDAEKKMDDEREKMFQREKTRIERLAESANNTINFNAALNTGDMDEAARLFNTAGAQEQQWSIDDQMEAMGDAAQQRQEKLQNQSDALKASKDARLEALRQEREAEKTAMEDRQREASDLLKSQRQAAADGLAARKEAEREATENMIANATARQQAEQRELAARLRELQAFTPKNETELNAHIGRVEALYSDYGLNLRTQGSNWAGYIGTSLSQNMATAAAKLNNDIKWSAIGKQISDKMAAGLGVTAGQMEFFIKNGRFPQTGMITGLLDRAMAVVQGIDLSRHGGGEIGGPKFSQKDRTGVPRSASLFSNEYTALLKRGEFVVNERATRDNIDFLKAINAGDIGSAGGGLGNIGASAIAGRTLLMAEMVGRGMMQNAAQSIIGQFSGAGAAGGLMDSEAFRGAGGFSGPSGGTSQTERMWNTIKQHFPRAKLNDALRPGANDIHGRGKAIDIGLQGVPGGLGNSYMAAMNTWIHDNVPNVYELIYDGLGDNRPDLKRGRPLQYSAGIVNAHKNHVHWAMEAFHRGGFAKSLFPQLRKGGYTLSEGLANLHKGEAVLTKPLTDTIINNVASGGDGGYNVNIEFSGPVNTQIDFERGVQRAIEKAESKKGRRRVVT